MSYTWDAYCIIQEDKALLCSTEKSQTRRCSDTAVSGKICQQTSDVLGFPIYTDAGECVTCVVGIPSPVTPVHVIQLSDVKVTKSLPLADLQS